MKIATRVIGMSIGTAMPMVAAAQSVTLYGVVDTGIEYVSNVGTAKDGLVRMPNLTGTVPSRWGVRGTEDLGGGLQSLFVLESGFALTRARLTKADACSAGRHMWG